MNQPGQLTKSEILSQPEAWAATMAIVREQTAAISRLWRESRPDTVVFTGCGSTYYASMLAAAALRMLAGIDARAAPASDLLMYP
ncbi:MAG: SIS domain-containing protein, partial [Thermomicrobiales bacterium]|nr:SIS domain-containing protein [Thermomicrobiales bacterium]